MRITNDLIFHAPAFINPVKNRELDLRGNKIPFLENLGATQDQFDAIDLSDNEISKLENFPILKRLTTLVIHNNRICKIADNIGTCLPKLQWLILNNNRMENFTDVEPLRGCKELRYLSLIDNPITVKKNYRLYVIHRLPTVKVLDYRKVKLKERQEAKQLFGDVKTTVFEPGEVSTASPDLTREQIEKIVEAIKNSNSAEEVQTYKRALATGQLPPNLVV